MTPDPVLLPQKDAPPRLFDQVAGSSLGTVFYTPGGAAGWALDLLLRVYLAYVRRPAAQHVKPAPAVERGPRAAAAAARTASF